ncbi:MAG: N-acetyl-gamma-glutamyl-phosphate reductase, partial [Proteobacteria bacterium]|nr:N-acetyl-gamma-glutamyl-phosphate reductase [Pseudomonadota bacterium]
MVIRAAVLGGSGFAGAELLRLCAGHPAIRPVAVFGDSQAGQAVAEALPHLANAYPGLKIDRFTPDLLDGIDLVFAALPHGRSQTIAGAVLDRGIPFVDLGADFRLKSVDEYATWYGEPHGAPELVGRFAYGLPEIDRAAVRNARAVAAPGCYPTAAILALKPLLDAGLVERRGIVVDAMSGVSGAGRGLKQETHFCTVDESVAAYGLLSHRHTAEMEQALAAQLLFTPHLVPMNRGMLATCHGVAAGGMDADAPLEALRAAYADEPFVQVSSTPPQTKWTLGSNAVHLTARYDARTGRVVAVAALDNLVKGAAGQMIQCANLMLGLDE